MWAVTAIAAFALNANIQKNAADNAEDDARKQAKEDRAAAVRAEDYALTEGEGQGQLGTVSLALDEEVSTALTSSANVSI